MTNFTNKQLEAWAGLEPIESKEYDGDSWWLYWSIVDQRGYTICDFHAHGEDFVPALAAAPALARALLAERKAREVGELRAAAEDLVSLCSADVKMNGTTYQPMPYRSAFTKAVERMIEALKGPTP